MKAMRPRRPKKWLTAALPAAAALALGLTACSSTDVAAENAGWAKSLCGAAKSPIEASQTALTDTGTVKDGETPKQLRTRMAGDMGALADANTKLAAAVQSAGAPKVGDGQKLQSQAVQELKQTAAGYTQVQQKVEQLPTDDQAEFAAALKSVSDQVQQLSQQSSSALNSLQTGPLAQAVQAQQGCKNSPVTGATEAAPASLGASPSAGGSAGQGSAGSSASSSASSSSASASASQSG
jgi:type VI protein secretion system component VasK